MFRGERSLGKKGKRCFELAFQREAFAAISILQICRFLFRAVKKG